MIPLSWAVAFNGPLNAPLMLLICPALLMYATPAVNDDTAAFVRAFPEKLIGFCCADCIDKFKTDPKKYMKDLK